MTTRATRQATVVTETRDSVLVVTLNRPEVRNAVNSEMARELASVIDEFESTAETRVCVLTGAPPSFCAGMDLGSFLIGDRPNGGYRGFAGIVEAPPTKPIVAAVEGAAVAGGFEIVLSCDVVVAAENARFGLPEVQRGLVAAGGALLRLPRRVPYQRAMEWVLTGRFLSASEVADAGLISRVVAPGAALGNALDIAESIAANGPLAVAASKRIIVESQDWTRAEEFSRQSEISEPVRNSTDAREGALAFQQKRQPIWRGV